VHCVDNWVNSNIRQVEVKMSDLRWLLIRKRLVFREKLRAAAIANLEGVIMKLIKLLVIVINRPAIAGVRLFIVEDCLEYLTEGDSVLY
jgi:hypothetical protein